MKITDYLLVSTVYDKIKEQNISYLDPMASSVGNPISRMSRLVTDFDWATITPEYEFAPELMAYDYYKSVDYWWVITRYNGIMNIKHPTYGFVANRRIKMPEVKSVEAWLTKLVTSNSNQSFNLNNVNNLNPYTVRV